MICSGKTQVEEPRVDYRLDLREDGAPHVQRVEGRWTNDLRLAWMWKIAKRLNSILDRKIAAIFAHTHAKRGSLGCDSASYVRKEIMLETALRPCAKLDENGRIILDERSRAETELRQRPALALLELAPRLGRIYAASL